MLTTAPNPNRTFFVASATYGRRALFQSDRMARLLLEVLYHYRSQTRFLLHEFVIMPNHLHLLITPAGDVSLEKALQFIKGGFSFRAKKELNFSGSIWEAGFTNHRIHERDDYERHSAYIRENPVKAHLCECPELFLYSSARPGIELDAAPPGLKPIVRSVLFRGS